uniref:Replication protein A OB domain-containing protein n=1 Tax=Triticum urartu TaxID=4572 RepID=A0A8R7QHJ8_TRIUA
MSNERISLLSHIHEKVLFWNAKVLVSRIWHFRGGTDEGNIVHTDLVVLDQEGTHMYGQIPPEPSERLKDVLVEGNVYLMKGFMCKQAKQTYRAVDSPYMMQFTRFSTAIPQPGDEENFPYCTYDLLSFTDIPMPGPNTRRFLDVIGRITAVTDIVIVHSQYQPEPSETRTIVLEDQAGNEIKLVLWGARAREFEAEEVRIASQSGAVIAIFVGTLPKTYRGIKGLSGSSACRWYINEDLPEMNAFRASLPESLAAITANIPGEQAIVPAPVREPPVELSVQQLLALDPFNNLKKQFMVKVIITRMGSDNRWWFLSCRECHKTAYTAGRQYRCSDHGCSSVAADPSYCLCTFGSDDAAEAEFMFFDRAAKSDVGKPLMTLIYRKYPGFTSALDLPYIGGADVGLPVEISRLVTKKYRLVVSISTKSFQPASTQLSFQVGRIDETFKPELASFGFGGASSSAGSSGIAVPIPTSFAAGSSTLVDLPPDEMNTPISAFRGKGQASMPKTPSKSPCPKSARRKLVLDLYKSRDEELSGSAPELATQTGDVVPPGNVVQPASMPNVSQENEAAATENSNSLLPDPSKTKRANIPAKGAGTPKKARQ